MQSFAVGGSCTARGSGSFAHGGGCDATDNYSYAGGYHCEASGEYSHAQNYSTIAGYSYQTAMGKRNANKSTSLLEVGNGTYNTRSNALELNQNGNLTIAGTLTQSSDRRLKEHIDYLGDDAIEFIDSLKPAHFIKDSQHHTGFYAQDVEEADKWHCMTGEMNGFKTLGYTEIIAPLVAYVQKLEKRIEELEKGTEQ